MTGSEAAPAIGTPGAEVDIDSALVAALLEDQHPELAHLPLHAVDAGWDNAMFRLGDAWAVRLPRRALAAPLIVHEQTWLPHLAQRLTLPVPAPYRIGAPAHGYPWAWSVVPWLSGTTADQTALDAQQAAVLAAFLRSLHMPAPAHAPINPVRGVALRERADALAPRIERLAANTHSITPAIRHIWSDALAAPLDLTPTWIHGDLHPSNILVQDGRISAVIDWGDITSGDRATDLASIWMLFDDRRARHHALTAYGELSHATLQRAKGWAVLFGVVLLDTGLNDNRRHAVIGERVLRRVAEAP
jgi:aminoglycoside phosphotransferase (APT) family kinase protein